MRGLKDVSFIYLDEAEVLPPGQQQDARDVSERYIQQENPYIIMCRNLRYQMADRRIEKEPEESCLYLEFISGLYSGLGKIYTEEEIAGEAITFL